MRKPSWRSRVLTLLAVMACMSLTQALPVSATSSTGQITGCGSSSSYGCTYWWDWSLTGNMIPGQTVYYVFNLYNTAPSGNWIRLDSFEVVTPWGTYTDSNLPQQIKTGYDYFNEIAITIPADASPGSVQGSVQFTGVFMSGLPFCSGTADVCSESANFNIVADPNVLQTQIATLQSQVTALQSKVANESARVATLSGELKQANSTLAADNKTIASDQISLTLVQSNLITAKANLNATQAELAAANSNLVSKEAALQSTQSSLNTATGLYLPLAVAAPSMLALVLAVLYFRKKSTSGASKA